MIARPVLAALASCLIMASAQAAEMQVKDGDAPFCEDLGNLKLFLDGIAARGRVVFDEIPRCEHLKADTRLDVVGEAGAWGSNPVVAVIVHATGGPIPGYTLAIRIEPAS